MDAISRQSASMIKEIKDIFIRGAIHPDYIAKSIAHHQSRTMIGGHSIFLGQVRADEIDGKVVSMIEYTAYEEIALHQMHNIREDMFEKYSLTCMHVHHSLGPVRAGEICLFVFTSAPHRKAAIDACEETVERLKAELPVWGKEIFNDETYNWKENI